MSACLNGRVILLLPLSVILLPWVTHGIYSDHKNGIDEAGALKYNNKSIGRAVKCNETDPTLVSFTWSPKDLSPKGEITFTISYTAPYDMGGAFLNVTMYFHGEPEPFIGYSIRLTCDEIKTNFHVKCPLQKRTHITISNTITNLHALTSFPGSYDGIFEVRNENDQEMLCLNVTLTIKEI